MDLEKLKESQQVECKSSFTNPGTLYGSLTFKDLENNDYVSSIRNKLLAEAFYLTGDIEKSGNIKRDIKELMNSSMIEYTIPDKPQSRLQKYRLTKKGEAYIGKIKG